VTLSERQTKYAQQRVAAVGLAGRVEVRLQDYRDILVEAEFG
jgi:cyclopropane-fatty-acyl-phospholipid synthase